MIATIADIDSTIKAKGQGNSGAVCSTDFRAFWRNGEYGMRTMASITMNIPRPGYVLLIFAGYTNINNRNRIMDIGIGTDSSSFNTSVYVEGMGCNGKDDHGPRILFTVSAVLPVSAGTSTFYGLAKGRFGHRSGNARVNSEGITGLFIPR
jgi:hypothetical protein